MKNKPNINELGIDLLKPSKISLVLVFLRPLILTSLFFLLYSFEIYWILPVVIFILFVTIINLTHDLVHNALGLNYKLNETLIALSGLLILESGHSYKVTHHLHHNNFPHKTDPEGEPAKHGFWRALAVGPLYIPKLFLFAFNRSKKIGDHKTIRWMKIELFTFIFLVIVGLALIPLTKSLITYCIMVVIGGWFYPLITVYMPHRVFKGNELNNTIRYKGKIASIIFLNQIYHLEHHLYPQVPTSNLKKLSKQLTPYFDNHQTDLIEKKLI